MYALMCAFPTLKPPITSSRRGNRRPPPPTTTHHLNNICLYLLPHVPFLCVLQVYQRGRWSQVGGECVDEVIHGCFNNGTCVGKQQPTNQPTNQLVHACVAIAVLELTTNRNRYLNVTLILTQFSSPSS